MALVKGWLVRLRGLVRKRAIERELDDEIRHHIALETEANLQHGLSPAEARRRAMVAFGGVEQVKEDYRDGRGGRWLEELVSDLRFALRALRRAPAITTAAVLTLALGVGANTAVFSVVNAVVLRSLPFSDPDRLVMLSEDNPEKGWRRQFAAPANFLDWRERVTAFRDVAAYSPWGRATLTGEGAPRLLTAALVTGNFFRVLGVRPALGRLFDSTETWKIGSRIAVLSHRAWRREFGGADVQGRTVKLDGEPTQIVGVAPEGFAFPTEDVDVFRPAGWDPASRGQDWFRRAHWLRVIARLAPGRSFEEADAEFQVVVKQLQREYPATNRVMGADLMPLHAFLVSDVRLPLLVLQGAVTLLLLIGCANVGNLLLVQAAGREREVALRLTLGAGRGRLFRQAITESLTLALVGGTAGVLLAIAGTRLLAARIPRGMLPVQQIAVDGQILGYAFGIAIVSGLVFGVAPVLWNRRRLAGEIIREGGGRGTDSRRARRLGNVLAIAEVGLALLLAVGAGLLVRSFQRLLDVDPGFDTRNILTVGLNLPEQRYDSSAKVVAFFDQLMARARTLPGVELAATAVTPPLAEVSTWTSDFHVEGRPADEYGVEASHESVSPDYFRLLRIPIQKGRAFTEQDRQGSTPVVIINDALARKYFGGESPIGKRLVFSKVPDSTSIWRTIVGVVASVRQASLATEPAVEIFAPAAQDPNSYSTLLVRTASNPADQERTIRSIIAELDPNLAIARVGTMESLKVNSVARQRFLMLLLSVFAITGVVLAIVGVYGVMAQHARRQVRDMGIRIALGARAGAVQWLVVRQGLAFVVVGVGLGMGVAIVATRAMREMLFEIRPTDPLTYLAATLILGLASLAATWLPARRASRSDPVSVLRSD